MGKQMNKKWLKYLIVSFCILQAAPITTMAAGSNGQTGISLFTKETGVALETKAGMSYDKVAISQVTKYVNVRAEASTNSAIVGKIYNNCAALILSSVNGEDGLWYQIESGNVTGYIKAEYFITGAEAEQLAKKVGTQFARIKNATTLRLREKPSLDSKTLTLLAEGAEYIMEAEEGDFAKICVDTDLTGYVSKDYIETWIVFDTAVTLEEEKAKQEESEKRKQEADEAIRQLEEIKQIEMGNPLGIDEQNGNTGTDIVVIPGGDGQSGENTGNNAQVPIPGSQTAQNDVITIQPGSSHNAAGSGIGSLVPGGPGENAGTDNANGANNPNNTSNTNNTNNTNNTANTNNTGNKGNANGTGNNGTGNGSNPSQVPGGPNSSQNTGTTATADKQKVETATRTAIVAYAKQFLGNPYVYGGTSLTNGTDCSGFVQGVFAHFGITTGRSSRDQAAKGKTIAVSDVQPGDLLFYASGDYINHVAIYIGGNQVIHASNSRTGIIISPANYRTPYKAVTFLK